MYHPLHRPRRERRGAVAPLVALLLTVLLGMTALALEGGNFIEQRRKTQAAADMAAMAAAADLYGNYGTLSGVDTTGTAKASALQNAKDNGFKNDAGTNTTADTSTVTVLLNGSKYTGGANSGTDIPAGYVEVTITKYVPRYFSQIWGSSTIAVKCRAVARGQWAPAADGVIALQKTGTSVYSDGGGTMTVTGSAPVIVNSNGTPAITGNVTAAGGVYSVGTASLSTSSTTYTLPGPIPDPLAYIPEPSASASSNALGQGLPTDPAKLPGTVTSNGLKYEVYGPGVYSSPPSPSGKGIDGILFQPDPNHSSYAPVVILNSGWGTMSQSTVKTSGIMIFAEADATHFSGKSVLDLTGPSTGPYAGIAFFQDRANTTDTIISGQGNVSINGAFYAPASNVTTRGNGGLTVNGQVIMNGFDFRGNGAMTVNYSNSKVGKARVIQLVE